jgi:hypothetical protein
MTVGAFAPSDVGLLPILRVMGIRTMSVSAHRGCSGYLAHGGGPESRCRNGRGCGFSDPAPCSATASATNSTRAQPGGSYGAAKRRSPGPGDQSPDRWARGQYQCVAWSFSPRHSLGRCAYRAGGESVSFGSSPERSAFLDAPPSAWSSSCTPESLGSPRGLDLPPTPLRRQ